MKNLLILRHAKSAYPSDISDDFERPLNKRGRGDLPRLARLLERFGPRPDTILCSPARRARETVQGLELAAPIDYRESLYLATVEQLEETLATAAENCPTVLLVGHNPGLGEWLEELTGAHVQLPTAALAAVQLGRSTWARHGDGPSYLQWLVVPRMLRAYAQE